MLPSEFSQIEDMEANPTSGDGYLALLASSDTNTNELTLFRILTSTGQIMQAKKINSSVRSEWSVLDARVGSTQGYKTFMMKDWDSIYMSINTNDNSEMGLMRLNNFSVNGHIAMYAYTTCTNMTTC